MRRAFRSCARPAVGLALAWLHSSCSVSHFAPEGPLTRTPDAEFRAQPPPPLPIVRRDPPQVQHFMLANGMAVFVVERRDLPIVSIRYVNRWASELGPAADAGLATLTAQALCSAGTLYENGKELRDVHINAEAAYSSVNRAYSTVGFSVGSSALETATGILSRIVRHPTFADLGPSRQQVMNAGLAHWNGVYSVGQRIMYERLAGRNDARALRVEVWARQLQAFDTARIRAFYEQRYQPEGSALVVVGDVAASEVVRIAKKTFESWPHAGAAPPPLPPKWPPDLEPPTHVLWSGGDTSYVMLAVAGVPFAHTDHTALELLAYLLTGTFTSRAQLALRHETGLSYFVQADVIADASDGVFLVRTAVRGRDLGESLERLTAEINALTAHAAGEVEIAQAKIALARKLRGELGTNHEIAERLSALFAYGDPAEQIARIEQELGSLSADELRRVANRYLSPASRLLLVIGNHPPGSPELRALGRVRHYMMQ